MVSYSSKWTGLDWTGMEWNKTNWTLTSRLGYVVCSVRDVRHLVRVKGGGGGY